METSSLDFAASCTCYFSDRKKYDTTINAVGNRTFSLSPSAFLFFFNMSVLFIDFSYLAFLNLPSSSCNKCHKTAYLSYFNYLKQLFSYLGSC